MVEEGEQPPAHGERGLGIGRQESGAHLSKSEVLKGDPVPARLLGGEMMEWDSTSEDWGAGTLCLAA